MDWLPAGLLTNIYGQSQFTDPSGTNHTGKTTVGRFYRALRN